VVPGVVAVAVMPIDAAVTLEVLASVSPSSPASAEQASSDHDATRTIPREGRFVGTRRS
jgi:hypothetical protein